MKLSKWERGVKLETRADVSQFAYLWFYEWHLFDSGKQGEHPHGSHDWEWTVNADGTTARMHSTWINMKVEAAENGAEMTLEITNGADFDWPDIAAIIPCFNPGDPKQEEMRNPIFLDEQHDRTYFLGRDGLDLIKGEFPREIHFNHAFGPAIMDWPKEREDGKFQFAEKWPTSQREAYGGLMARESDDKRWTMGVAWESYISAQGHNPWNCMHLSVRVGPLKQTRTKTIRGKMYLIEGSKEDCLRLYRKDFAGRFDDGVGI